MNTLKFLPFILCFLCLGCEDIIECIINKSPELPNKTFQLGYINSYYQDELEGEIKNEPQDDNYAYRFEIYGDLPYGLEMNANDRILSIEGTPEISGTFTFKIYLFVDPPEYYDDDTGSYEDALCSYSTSKEYTITIN